MSKRTLGHYQSLVEAGYTRYISINRFDVARAATPFENAPANGRYGYQKTDLGVNVIFAKSSRLFEASGRATEIGEVGAIILFSEPEVIDGLGMMKPQAGDMVTIRYLEAGRSASGRVIDADLKNDPAIVEVEYARLLSIADIGVGAQLEVADTRFVLSGPEDQIQTIDLIGRRLFLFFEAVEGVRALSNGASARQPDPAYAPPPLLQRLSIASPADILVELAPQMTSMMPLALIAVVLKRAWELPAKRKEWLEGTGQRHQNSLAALEVQLKELELQARRDDAALRSEMIERLRAAFSDSEMTDEESARTIDDFVLPPLRALGRSGVDSLEPPDEPDEADQMTSVDPVASKPVTADKPVTAEEQAEDETDSVP